MAASSPSISNLFFADDRMVFFRAKRRDCLHVRSCQVRNERAIGQMINFEKSSLTFSPNTTMQMTSDIKSIPSVEVVSGHKLYLGLPTFSLRKKISSLPTQGNAFVIEFKIGALNFFCWQ